MNNLLGQLGFLTLTKEKRIQAPGFIRGVFNFEF